MNDLQVFLMKHFPEVLKENPNVETAAITVLKKLANISEQTKIKFAATILFNRGLGEEYYSLIVEADTPEEAKETASIISGKKFGKKSIIDISIRPA